MPARETIQTQADDSAPPVRRERFDLYELTQLVQRQAIGREQAYQIQIRAGFIAPSAASEREIRMWYAAAEALDFASMDPEGYREFCRSVGKRKGGRR